MTVDTAELVICYHFIFVALELCLYFCLLQYIYWEFYQSSFIFLVMLIIFFLLLEISLEFKYTFKTNQAPISNNTISLYRKRKSNYNIASTLCSYLRYNHCHSFHCSVCMCLKKCVHTLRSKLSLLFKKSNRLRIWKIIYFTFTYFLKHFLNVNLSF